MHVRSPLVMLGVPRAAERMEGAQGGKERGPQQLVTTACRNLHLI